MTADIVRLLIRSCKRDLPREHFLELKQKPQPPLLRIGNCVVYPCDCGESIVVVIARTAGPEPSTCTR